MVHNATLGLAFGGDQPPNPVSILPAWAGAPIAIAFFGVFSRFPDILSQPLQRLFAP